MRTLAIISGLCLMGCAGQNIYVPIPIAGSDRNGNPTAGVKSVPIFKNTGNLANADFAYSGVGGTVRFHADVVDNAIATYALHEGISKTVRSGGSVIGTALAGWAGIAAVTSASAASIAASNNATKTSVAQSGNATKVALGNQATKVSLAEIAARPAAAAVAP